MAIELSTFLDFSGGRVLARALKATQNDIVVTPHPGVIPVAVLLGDGSTETVTYPTLTVNNADPAPAYDETTIQIVYAGATAKSRPAGGYYAATASGEILFVEGDSGAAAAAGTLTVRRGCLGTTPSATGLADNDTLYVLSSLTLTSVSTGPVRIVYVPYPDDPGVRLG